MAYGSVNESYVNPIAAAAKAAQRDMMGFSGMMGIHRSDAGRIRTSGKDRPPEDLIGSLFIKAIDLDAIDDEKADIIMEHADSSGLIAGSPELLRMGKAFMKDILHLRAPRFMRSNKDGQYICRTNATIAGGPATDASKRDGKEYAISDSYDASDPAQCIALGRDILGSVLGVHVTVDTMADVRIRETDNLNFASYDGKDMEKGSEIKEDDTWSRERYTANLNHSNIYAPEWLKDSVLDDEGVDNSIFVNHDKEQNSPTTILQDEIARKDTDLKFPIEAENSRDFYRSLGLLSDFIRTYDDTSIPFSGKAERLDAIVKELFSGSSIMKDPVLYSECGKDGLAAADILRAYISSVGLDNEIRIGAGEMSIESQLEAYNDYRDARRELNEASKDPDMTPEKYAAIRSAARNAESRIPYPFLSRLCSPDRDIVDSIERSNQLRKEAEPLSAASRPERFYIPPRALASYDSMFLQAAENLAAGRTGDDMLRPVARIPNYVRVSRSGSGYSPEGISFTPHVAGAVPVFTEAERDRILGIFRERLPEAAYSFVVKSMREYEENVPGNEISRLGRGDEERTFRAIGMQLEGITPAEMRAIFETGIDGIYSCIMPEETDPTLREDSQLNRIDPDIARDYGSTVYDEALDIATAKLLLERHRDELDALHQDPEAFDILGLRGRESLLKGIRDNGLDAEEIAGRIFPEGSASGPVIKEAERIESGRKHLLEEALKLRELRPSIDRLREGMESLSERREKLEERLEGRKKALANTMKTPVADRAAELDARIASTEKDFARDRKNGKLPEQTIEAIEKRLSDMKKERADMEKEIRKEADSIPLDTRSNAARLEDEAARLEGDISGVAKRILAAKGILSRADMYEMHIAAVFPEGIPDKAIDDAISRGFIKPADKGQKKESSAPEKPRKAPLPQRGLSRT